MDQRINQDLVAELDRMLAERRVGLVAHYYMDPELQVGGCDFVEANQSICMCLHIILYYIYVNQ